MKGIIRDNLGDSRYVVGVTVADQPLADELKKYQDLYDATIPRITDAYGALNDLRDGYNAALDAIAAVAADYELCRLAFSSTNCLATGRGACESAYLEADAACLEIESGIGECDPDCQRERARCQESAKSVRSACLAQVEIDCAEAEFKHIEECQKTWAPLIAKAQEAALKLLPGMQEALYNLQHEQALQWQLARKLNELEGIQAREYEITCFSAQYNEDLSGEVEMARTPNGRHVITGLVTAPTPCLHDARVLPSGHLFVNAALWPGFETWRPTWRVGTVKEVIAPKLKIEFAPANMAGGLGTLYTENPLDCTPPQIYFDGKSPLEAEADIKAARDALNAAQQDLLELVKVRTECIAEYDQAWFDQCYGAAVEICDAAFGEAMEQPTLDKGQCYEDAQTTCQEQTEAGLAACTESFQPAIDEAQVAVDGANATLTEANNDLIAAQGVLAAIQAEIQECIDIVNSPAWLDERWQVLEASCKHDADYQYDLCRENGGTAAACRAASDALYADCLVIMQQVLIGNQQDAIGECTWSRQPDIDAAELVIAGAFTAVNNAEIALRNVTDDLEAAQQALKDCQDGFVYADCLASALQLCDDTFQMAEDTYTQQKSACYQEAMAECDRQRDEAIQACYDDNAEAIDAAQIAVDEATRDVELATNGRYNPANPLILDCPVAHCSPENYQVGDEVLVDFPVRSGTTAMAVWDSRRVIGWAQNTRTCQPPSWPERVEIHIICTVAAAASRRCTVILGQPGYTCPTSWEDVISYATVFAYNSSLMGEFVWDSFTYPGFEAIPQAGISASSSYTDNDNVLVGTNSYIIRSMPSGGAVAYLDRYECNLAHCAPSEIIDYLEDYWGIRIFHGSNELTRLDNYAAIVEHLGIPATATLKYLETGATKNYTIDPDSYGSTGHGSPDTPATYSGAIVISYRPPPEA